MFMGGLLMIIGSIMEFYLGNTFSFVVFASLGTIPPPHPPNFRLCLPYRDTVNSLLTLHFSLRTGGFWLSFAATLIPWYNAAGAYSKTGNAAEGANSSV